MTIISGENISKQFDDRVLFDNLSFSVNRGDRIALVGPNGIGKTTLFNIMAGRIRPDRGELVRSRDCTIGYVEQEFDGSEERTLVEFVASARQDILAMQSEIAEVEKRLHDTPDSPELIRTLGELQHSLEAAGGYDLEAQMKIILIGLGFPENRFHNRLKDFSGGEKNRAALAKILVGRGTLLLLDEPTNHLDIDSTIWLEEYLNAQESAFIIVSHDRAFLTNTVEKVWEISSRKVDQYFNGFETYLIEREERKIQLEHQYKHQQEEIKRIEEFIRRNIAGQKTKQAQSKLKYLSRIKRIELPKSGYTAPSFTLDSGQRSHNLVLAVESAAFGYGNRALVSDVDFNLYRSERAGLIGRNGSGKTTILKTIIGELDVVNGSIRVGQKVSIAYFDQELSDLDDTNTVLDELWMVDPSAEAGKLRSFLARFGFRGEDVFKKVAVLSGGEKTKLVLAKLLFQPANFLIFDEPTNHLDLDSRQAMEEALQSYDGTLLIVSHDRFFLDQVADRIIAIEDDSVRIFQGNYSYYREKKEEEKQEAVFKRAPEPERIKAYAEFKKQSQAKSRIKKEIRSVESKIKDSETVLHRLEKDILHNIPKTDWEKLAAASREKSRVEELLLELYNRLDELRKTDAEHSDSDRQPG
jgi:ATP-binding cassette subfamily F protein 3